MKHEWEYKKLGEVVSSINGLWTGKKEPFITIPVISLKNFTKDCKLKKEDYSIIDVEVRQFESRKLQYGDIIIEKSGGSDTQPVGRPILFDIKEGDYSFSNFTTTLRVNDANKELLNSLFLHNVLLAYYRQGKTFSLQSKTTGIHNLDLKGYLNLPIPIPPLPTQQSIVSELDSLSKIIADCKETLKDYDALEQSIFYDMFGDITDIVPLSEYVNGFTTGKSLAGEEENKYKVLKSGAVTYDEFDSTSVKNYPLDYNPDSKHLVKKGDLLVSRMNTAELVGACAFVWDEVENLYLPDRIWKAILNDNCNPIFVWKAITASDCKRQIRDLASGTSGTMKNISMVNMLTVKVKKVDLSLQQAFASKMEFIRQMKSETKKALQETETLFQARMDYWFNG